MWLALAKFLGSGAFSALVDGYKAKLAADNTADKIAADLAGKDLELQGRERELNSQIIISDSGRWWTAAPRAIVCWAFALYIAKVVLIDSALGWGTTPALKGMIAEWGGTVICFWFGGRTLEKVARIFRPR